MKNQLSRNLHSSFRNILIPAALVFVLAVSAIPSDVSAQLKTTKVESPINVKFLGKVDYYPVFQVSIDNALGDFYYFMLTDPDGNVLYSDKFRDKKFSKKFQFVSDNLDNARIMISIISKNDKKSQSFEISTVSTLGEDVIVTKL